MKWSEIPGWFTWSDVYDRMAKEVPPRGIIVELGVWKGRSLAYLGQKLLDLGRSDVMLFGVDLFNGYGHEDYKEIISVDKWHGETRTLYEQTRSNLDACGLQNVVLLIEDCICAADHFENGQVDFLFIDDLHESDHVSRELDAWLPKLRRPTWIAGDDYGLVADAINSRFGEKCRTDNGGWLAQIP